MLYPKQQAEKEFMELTKDMKCGKQWLQSQQVYCQLPIEHAGMCESEAVSDAGEECTLYWISPAKEKDHETSKDD
jgi:hypothetical protein